MEPLRMHKNVVLVLLCALILGFWATIAAPGPAAASPKDTQRTFASPGEAVQALIEGMKAGNTRALSAIFGPRYMSRFASGDKVSDRADREWFVRAYGEKNSLEKKGDDKVILHVGNDDWPFPIPLVKKGDAWSFDSRAGKEELLNRRVGRNELRVIETMEAYVAAQREYASRDPMGGRTHAYAQRFMSTPGKKDGLYWKTKEGEEQSPLGPLVATAAREGYAGKTKASPSPFHGYYFRILTGQGGHAPGGPYDYVVKGNMILGFGLIAYPAKYGSSGIMTFLVNQSGVVYQKDLGGKTVKTAAAIRKYDPDGTWEKVK